MNLDHDVQVGDKVFILTSNLYWVGVVKSTSFDWIVLEKASMIADTGRFHNAMISGDFSEVEPCMKDQKIRVQVGSISVMADWPHALPTQQK